MISSVIEHMNSDHSEACLCIVQAFSQHRAATGAQLVDLDRQGLLFKVQIGIGKSTDQPVNEPKSEKSTKEPASESISESSDPDLDSDSTTLTVSIKYPKALRDESQIRGILVGMTRQARQILSEQNKDS